MYRLSKLDTGTGNEKPVPDMSSPINKAMISKSRMIQSSKWHNPKSSLNPKFSLKPSYKKQKNQNNKKIWLPNLVSPLSTLSSTTLTPFYSPCH